VIWSPKSRSSISASNVRMSSGLFELTAGIVDDNRNTVLIEPTGETVQLDEWSFVVSE